MGTPLAILGAAIGAAAVLSGCISTTRNPERLHPLSYELGAIKAAEDKLRSDYLNARSQADAKYFRNEIIAQRMYAIDLQYTEDETALTRESQEIGFAALTSAGTLTTASTLFASAATKSIMAAVAAAIIGAKGHYESEVLLAQTIRTIQKQMRASRNLIAASIAAKMTQDTGLYPLAAALSDVEDYYNAGTLTTGVIDTSTTVGLKESVAKIIKQEVTQASESDRADILREATNAVDVVRETTPKVITIATYRPDNVTAALTKWLYPGGVLDEQNRKALNDYAISLKPGLSVNVFLKSAEYEVARRDFARRLGLLK